MFLMSTSLLLSSHHHNVNIIHRNNNLSPHNSSSSSSYAISLTTLSGGTRRRGRGFISCAESSSGSDNENDRSAHYRKRSWWQRFFLDEDGNWLGLRDEDMLEDNLDLDGSSGDDQLAEDDKFEAWKRRAEAITELREAQEDMRNEESRRWEDWLVDGTADAQNSRWNDYSSQQKSTNIGDGDLIPERGLVELLEIWSSEGKMTTCYMRTVFSLCLIKLGQIFSSTINYTMGFGFSGSQLCFHAIFRQVCEDCTTCCGVT